MQKVLAGTFVVDPSSAAQADCPNGEDYSPCTCSMSYIDCKNATLSQVSSVFRRTTAADLGIFTLHLSQADANEMIPPDLLNNHRAQTISIDCPRNDFYLRVDPQAFRSSKDTTERIYNLNCDMSRLDFKFLTGFVQLDLIDFRTVASFGMANWSSFPPLPKFDKLYIYSSTGLNEWTTFPQLVKGLTNLLLQHCDIQDEAMDRILNGTVQYSADTLKQLVLNLNDMTKIPRPIASFQKLDFISMYAQMRGIPFIPAGSFYSGANDFYLALMDNQIEMIQQGAFQGINDFVVQNNFPSSTYITYITLFIHYYL